jgi:hypothetical protein
LLFLFALLIGASKFWGVLGIVSMFTLAHSITLSMPVLGLVNAPVAVVEPLIALSIIWVAVEKHARRGSGCGTVSPSLSYLAWYTASASPTH